MDRYEVMAGKMAPLTDGAHRKWGFTGISPNGIGSAASGMAGGYHWEYADD